MTFLEGERVIDRLENRGLILTTHRIREGTERDFTSIMLEQICSIAVQHVAKTWLLISGVAAIAGAVISAEYQKIDWQSAAVMCLLGLILVVSYILTRFSAVEIASGAAHISVRVPRRNPGSVLRLIDAIEFAKSERMKALSDLRASR